MDIKQILATLLANADSIQDQDVGLLADMLGSYQFEGEPAEQDPEHEAQESPEVEALEQESGVELGEPLGEVQEEPIPQGEVPPAVEEVPAEQPSVEQGAVVEGEPIVEDQAIATPDPMEAVLSEIQSLRSEIDALKTSLSKVAVREEVGEDDEEETEIGARSKPANARVKDNDVQEALLAKFGGRAR